MISLKRLQLLKMAIGRCWAYRGSSRLLFSATLLLLEVLILNTIHNSKILTLALQQQQGPTPQQRFNEVPPNLSRRSALERSVKGIIAAVVLPATSASPLLFLSPEPAVAARGAAELDLEYYVRDLIGGNKKEGNILPSVPPNLPPPRTLGGPLLPLLLNDECSPSCIPTQALLEGRKITSSSVEDSVNSYRTKASRSFASRTPWVGDNVSDQYYFDLTAYALWRTAADLIPNYADRDVFARSVGRKLYQQLKADHQITTSSQSDDNHPLQDTMPEVFQILNLFQSSGYCTGYRIRTQDSENSGSNSNTVSGKDNKKRGKSSTPEAQQQQQQQQQVVFDDLDEESLTSGLSVDCLVSVYDPASLGASLQITGEQSRFSPDFVGATLAAAWETVGIKSSWETLFVDPVYRPNPKDYYPNEQLYQFTLSK